MKKLFFIITIAAMVVSCKSDNSEGGEIAQISTMELDEIKKENLQLKREITDRDSTINQYVRFINEIRTNLDIIRSKQGLIVSQQLNPENIDVSNENLVEDIKTISQLMNDNEAKIKKLKAEIKNNNVQMDAFEEMILSLTEEIEKKNMEIYQLQQELENTDAAFSELFAAYEEKAGQLDIATDQLNTAYYTYGTKEELLDNNVITKEGGFIGIGKTNKLKSDFNQDYFTAIKIDSITSIPLGVDKAEIITAHPADSYKLVTKDKIESLEITNPEKFWMGSKYLVIVVK